MIRSPSRPGHRNEKRKVRGQKENGSADLIEGAGTKRKGRK